VRSKNSSQHNLFFSRIYSMNLHKVQGNLNNNKNCIKILGPPNDYYCRRNESPTRRCCRSHTGVGLILLMTVGKSSSTCP
jgi:hypothetical protein